jgi:hypothetical protein
MEVFPITYQTLNISNQKRKGRHAFDINTEMLGAAKDSPPRASSSVFASRRTPDVKSPEGIGARVLSDRVGADVQGMVS